MIDITAFIVLSVLTIRIFIRIRGQASVFREFAQSTVLAPLVLLFPVGPLVLLFLTPVTGTIIAFLLSVACYLPALLVSSRQKARLECAGTSRVDEAEKVATITFATAIGGIAFSVLAVLFVGIASGLGRHAV